LNMVMRGGPSDGYEYGYYYVDYSVQRERREAEKERTGRRGRKGAADDLVPLMSETATEDAASAEALPSRPADESISGAVPAAALASPPAAAQADSPTSTLPRVGVTPAGGSQPVGIDEDLTPAAPASSFSALREPARSTSEPVAVRDPYASGQVNNGPLNGEAHGTSGTDSSESSAEDAFRR
jgi:hypothetical protein